MDVYRGRFLSADFFTATHRISGRISTRHKLADALNDRTTSFLELWDAYVSRISHPGDISATYSMSSLVKDNIMFTVVPRKEGIVTERPTYALFGRQTYEVFLTVPSFEIRGTLEAIGKLELKALLATGTEQFMALTDASAVVALYPDITFAGEAILVNKAWIQLFCIDRETDS